MKIVISAYQEGEPRDVEEVYDPKKLDLELVDLKFLEDLKLKGVILREPTTVSFSGRLTSKVRRICGRTLKEVDEPLDIPFSFYYETADKETIDTLDDIREAVLIEQPMVYFAPGAEDLEINYEDKEPESAPDSKIKIKDNDLLGQLKKLRDRLKEE